jgi:hypothetical protein
MKRLILAFSGLVVIAALVGGAFYGRPAYRHYKEARGLRQAAEFLAAGDLENASVSARQVLQLNPKSVEACRIMADLAERYQSPTVIDWWHRVAELAPTMGNRLKLASCALRYQRPPYTIAERALHELEPAAQGIPAFQVMSAELALRLNQLDEAAAHFQEAARLESANPLHQLNLAVLQLQSSNPPTAADARGTLEQLSTNHDVGLLALRWLVVHDLRREDLAGAERRSSRLLADPRAQWDDRLQHLSVLYLCGNAAASSGHHAFTEYLGKVQAAASTNPAALYSVCEWMGAHGLADDALKWLAGFGVKVRRAQPVPLAEANLYLAKPDWPTLETFLGEQNWADLEFLRLALLARAAWGQNRNVAGDARWGTAVRAAADRLGSLTLLLSLASEWDRDPEELLWQVGRHFPREQWALRELERRYTEVGNTRGLNRVCSARVGAKAGANDLTNQNNFATTSMLLRANLPQAHQIARELYRQQPADPIVASTYAYSLHLQGRTGEGLGVLGRVDRNALATPAVALYYGVLLAASGDIGQASRYLAIAENANLLPEEKELMAQARNTELPKP